MLGAIQKRDILAHPLVTIRCFGWSVFLRTLFAGRTATFLDIVAENSTSDETCLPHLVNRCRGLERIAMRIYGDLAERFCHNEELTCFFRELELQEKGHSDLLQLCHAPSRNEQWDHGKLEGLRDLISRVESTMEAFERAAADIDRTVDALRLVLSLESSSELNEVFTAVTNASQSEFLDAMGIVAVAEEHHIRFIIKRVGELEPSLASECQTLGSKLHEIVSATGSTTAQGIASQPPSTQPPSTQPPSTQPPSTQPPSTQPTSNSRDM